MATELFANDAATTLAALLDATATSLTVTSAALFPVAVAGQSQFRVRIDDELLIVTDTAAAWTVVRGAESTTATTHQAGAAVTHVVTADALGSRIARSTVDAKGDLLAGTADDTVARVPVGSDGKVLTARASAAPGVAWEPAPVSTPAGTLLMWAGAAGSVPSGWLLCNGQAVSRTTYAALFAAIGTTYGPGDSSTTFNVPNLQSRLPRGASGADLGATGGAATHGHTASSAAAGSHAHNNPNGTAAAGSHAHNNPSGTDSAGSHAHNNPNGTSAAGTHGHGTSFESATQVSASGSGAVSADNAHTHTVYDSGSHAHGVYGTDSQGFHGHGVYGTDSQGSHSHTTGSTDSQGSHAHGVTVNGGDNLPPYINVNYMVCTG